MSFTFQIAGSGYAANYAQIARKLPHAFSLVQIVGRGSERSRHLADLSKTSFGDRLMVDVPAVVAVPPDQQLGLLRQSQGPMLIEPELHPDAIAEIRGSNRIFVANHWASFPAVKGFVNGYMSNHGKQEIRLIEIECSERALFPVGSILSSLWPVDDSRIGLEHQGGSRTNATVLPGLVMDYFSGSIDGSRLTLKVLRRSGDVDNGSDSPQIFSIRVTTDAGILQLLTPFGPVVSNNYLGSTSASDDYLSTTHQRVSMAQLRELRMKTNYMILDAFRCQVEEGRKAVASPYFMTPGGISMGGQLAALAKRPS